MITLITSNKGKLKEFQHAFGDNITAVDIPLPEIQSLDFKEVIEAKLLEARKHVKTGAIVVDDAGYYFKELGQLPGVFSKFFLLELGVEGIYNLISKLSSQETSHVCYLGYMSEEGEVKYFEGSVTGKFVAPRGEGGFGFDPLFVPDGYTTTFAEMTDEERFSLKPRSMTINQLKNFLDTK